MIRLNPAVADSLASFWCPADGAKFLTTLFAIAAAFCIVGIVLIRIARARGRAMRIAGAVLILFALGGAAFELLGLTGCTHIEKGVTWDWPW